MLLDLLDSQKDVITPEALEDIVIGVALAFENQDLSDPRIINGLLESYAGMVEELDDPENQPEYPDPGKGEEIFRETWIEYVRKEMKVSRERAEENYCGFFMDGVRFDMFTKKLLVRFAQAVGAKDCDRWRALQDLEYETRTPEGLKENPCSTSH